MTIKQILKNEINNILSSLYNIDEDDFDIEYPPQKNIGDYATNVAMKLAKKVGKKPIEIAEEIGEALKASDEMAKMFEKIEWVLPGFLNIGLKKDWVMMNIEKILEQKSDYGKPERKNQKIVIDYSSPNIAKQMHVGHLRSTVIGASLYNVYKFLGYDVIRDNHLGDWGTQFGKLIRQYKKEFGEEIKDDIDVSTMERLYIEFHEEAKSDESVEDEAREELKKLQDKEKFNYELWQKFCEKSIEEFKKIYNKLGVDFDTWHGESFYNDKLQDTVDEAIKKGVAKKSEGAIVIDFDDEMPPLMIQKSDGAFLYGTSDIATIKYREEKYNPVKCLYVVANQQALHFEQLFRACEKLEIGKPNELHHIKFGLVLGANGKKMSTREGGVTDLIDLIEKGIEKAKEKITEKNKNLEKEDLEKTAEIIALGAIKYNDLSQNRLTDINFDWDKMLSFESESSPYLQYTFVRIKSVLEKKEAQESKGEINWSLLETDEELALAHNLIKFGEAIESVTEDNKPNLLSLYLQNLAKDFHRFYENVNILKEKNEKTKATRLKLIEATSIIIESGLKLLGVECPEKM